MYGLKNVRQRRDDALSRVAWDQFESLLAVYYRGQGYAVDHCGSGAVGSGFDGGIDLKLRRADEYIVVQCKHWNAKQVPHNDVHQLLGIMVNEGATGAILVTSGEFTAAARQAADRLGHVRLIDGDALREMIGPLPDPAPRIFGGTDPSASRSSGPAAIAQPVVRVFAYKALFAVIFALVVLFTAMFLIRNALDALQRIGRPPAAAQTPVQPLPAPNAAAATTITTMPAPERIIEEPPPPPPAYRRPTEAEIRESQRKAEEAMKVLEATTPEV